MRPLIPRHDLSLEEADWLEDGLYQFNMRATGRRDGLGLGFLVHDDAGERAGGIWGYSWAGMAEIGSLWLRDDVRGEGTGQALIEAFLAEAVARGCEIAWVQSYTFQAPALYERCGFERVFEFKDWPPGHAHVTLKKHLRVTNRDEA